MAEVPQNRCRVCATDCTNTFSIFELIHDGKRSIDLLEYCFQQSIDTSEHFPKCICTECSSNLILTYELFLLYKRSEEFFQAQYQTGTNYAILDDFIKVDPTEPIAMVSMDETFTELKTEFDISPESMEFDNFFGSDFMNDNFTCHLCNKTYATKQKLMKHKRKLKIF